jgi:hypothetical protein
MKRSIGASGHRSVGASGARGQRKSETGIRRDGETENPDPEGPVDHRTPDLGGTAMSGERGGQRPGPGTRILGTACRLCPLCRVARRRPTSLVGRLLAHPLHADHCPFWKAEQALRRADGR